MIKKLLILLSIIPCVLNGGIQGGVTIPDQIIINNTTNKILTVENTLIKPGKKYSFNPAHTDGHISIRYGNKKYAFTCPTYNSFEPVLEVFTAAELDFTTMLCLAGDYTTINNSNGLDEVCLMNDTLYTIAAVVMLNTLRTNPRMLRPDETISKMVRDSEVGKIILTDENRKHYSITFPCQSSTRADNSNWSSVTLSANTIKWFGNGFKFKVAR